MRRFTAYHFTDAGTSRVHIVAWDERLGRWVMPCNNWPQGAWRASDLNRPLCRTCSRLTALAGTEVRR
jgi:hypothetical protein